MFHDPEVAWHDSGGGFSRHFTRPDYQKDAVNTFLEDLKDDYAGFYKCVRCRDLIGPIHILWLCSPAGRGIPDIGAQASKFQFIIKGVTMIATGTSCSAPVRHSIFHL